MIQLTPKSSDYKNRNKTWIINFTQTYSGYLFAADQFYHELNINLFIGSEINIALEKQLSLIDFIWKFISLPEQFFTN